MTGKLIGVGVGAGDPENMTLKAIRVIRENAIIAAPGEDVKETVAYKIAVQAVPELADKELLPLFMPMVMNREEMHRNHVLAAKQIEEILDKGSNVVFITLGDPTIYSTYSYVQDILKEDGYPTEIVSGIPSFVAAAAALNIPLTEWKEELHVIPAVHKTQAKLDQPGTYVLMKSGSHAGEVKMAAKDSGREAYMVENCGMPEEKLYHGVEEIPDKAGYFTLFIAKEQ